MNDKTIVNSMVKFIEEKEKKLQADKMTNDSQAKNDVVKAILDELEHEINEDKEN